MSNEAKYEQAVTELRVALALARVELTRTKTLMATVVEQEPPTSAQRAVMVRGVRGLESVVDFLATALELMGEPQK